MAIDALSYQPTDMLEDFKSISLTTDRGSTTIAVNSYRCRNPAYGGTADAEQVKDGFIGVSNRAIINQAGGAVPYVNVFVGKGSPEEFATVLGLVLDYKDAFVKTYGKYGDVRGQCAKLFAKYRDDQWAEMLQAFTDKYLGLDCNGFVGNYVRRARLSTLGPSNYPSEYFSRHRKRLRKTLNDVSNGDILVWTNMQHIAIIDTVLQLETGTRVSVCQSTAGGPQQGWYWLRSSGGAFELSAKPAGQFYVMGLDVH